MLSSVARCHAMGGHGGINILGQKSWHTYNLNNRLRVERDEIQHEQREQEALDAQNARRLERDVRALKRRNRGESPDRASPEAIKDADASSSSTAVARPSHINFFEEEEAELMRVEKEHEKRMRYQRRNNELAGVRGGQPVSEFDMCSKDVPWYARARAADPEDAEQDETTTQATSSTPSMLALPAPPSKKPLVLFDDEEKARKKKSKKEKKKEKKAKKRQRSPSADFDIEELRRERLARERAEQLRAHGVVRKK